jgi:hypothetical protein
MDWRRARRMAAAGFTPLNAKWLARAIDAGDPATDAGYPASTTTSGGIMSPTPQDRDEPAGLSRRDFVRIAGAATAGAAAVGGLGAAGALAAKKTKMDTPLISCGAAAQTYIELQVCAPAGTGATGAPAGFSIQWMTAAAFAANGNQWLLSDDPNLCKASFSGNANFSRYNLAAGQCVTVRIGDLLFDNGASTNCAGPLVCATDYVFRAFAHATSTLNRSDFTPNLTCSTTACGNTGVCTLTQGYWKTHGPEGCVTGNNTNTWPVTSLTLGTVTYTDLQLCSILNRPTAGNGLVALAHQLIAAKLNVANGADDSAVAADIAAADALIGSLVVPPVGSGSLAPSATSALTIALDDYNSGAKGPGHCDSE